MFLQVRGNELDHEYMRDLARHMGVTDLLERILKQAGVVD